MLTPVQKGEKEILIKDVFARGKIQGSRLLPVASAETAHMESGQPGAAKTLEPFPMPAAIQSIRDREWFYGTSILRKLSLIPPSPSPAATPGKKATSSWPWTAGPTSSTNSPTCGDHAGTGRAPRTILGRENLRERHGNLPSGLRSRIRLLGYVPSMELQRKYFLARISLSTSRSESTYIASAEALCAGASVEGPLLTPLLNCLQWYVAHDSGTLSPEDSPESIAAALLEEIRAWDEGQRSPEEISRYWCSQLHAENSCRRIITAYEADRDKNRL